MSWGTSSCSSSGDETLPPPDTANTANKETCLLRGCGKPSGGAGNCSFCVDHWKKWNSNRGGGGYMDLAAETDVKKIIDSRSGKPLCLCRGCFCVAIVDSKSQGMCSEKLTGRYCKCREKKSCPNARTPEHFALARQQVFSIACFGNTSMASVLATNYRIMQTAVLFIPCFNNNDLQNYRERREKKSSNQNVKPRYLDDKIVFLDTLLGSKSEKSESQQFLRAVAASLES